MQPPAGIFCREKDLNSMASKKPAKKTAPARRKSPRLLGTKADREERFAVLIGLGLHEPWRAYQLAGWVCGKTSAQVGAAKMLKNAKVSARVEEVRVEARERELEAGLLSRRDRMHFLCETVRKTLAELSPEDPHCIEYVETTVGEAGTQRKVKKSDPLRAIDLLNKMTGEYAPQRIQLEEVTVVIGGDAN